MKFIIRSFFRTLRIVLGPFMQVWEFVSRPKGVVRAPELQQAVNQQCQSLGAVPVHDLPVLHQGAPGNAAPVPAH